MANLSTLQTQIGEAGASLNEFISDNSAALITTGAILGGVALGVGGAAIVSKVSSSKKRKVSAGSKRKRSGRARDRKFISKQKHERAYQRRRKRLGKKTYGRYYRKRNASKRGIKYTKNGQPYIILKSGKARFIKKK